MRLRLLPMFSYRVEIDHKFSLIWEASLCFINVLLSNDNHTMNYEHNELLAQKEDERELFLIIEIVSYQVYLYYFLSL